MPNSPARVCLALLLFSLGLSAPAFATRESVPEPSAQADAEAHYQRGLAAYRAGRFREAIEEFLAAEQRVPSPLLAFNVALAYEKLDRPARALQYFRDYLRRGPAPSNALRVERRVEELATLLGEQGIQQLTVSSDPSGATLTIDGNVRGSTPWTGELALGIHRLSVAREGHIERVVEVELGDTQPLDVELKLLSESVRTQDKGTRTAPGPRASPGEAEVEPRVWPWAIVGAGGVVVAGAGVFELLRRDAQSDAWDAWHASDIGAWNQASESARTHQTTARVLAGVGSLLVVGGGIFLWVDAERSSEAPPVAFGCDTETCLGTWRGNF